MIKRPLAACALMVVVISLAIIFLIPGSIYPEYSTTDKTDQYLCCRVEKVEEKINSYYVFVNSGRYHHLLTSSKDLEGISDIRIGNTLEVSCLNTEWNRARNNGNFDERSYYRSLGIYKKYRIKNIKISDSSYSVLREGLRFFRNRLESSYNDCADHETAGIICAMVTGSSSELDSGTRDLFRMSGIAHIFAVSGLHISFVGMGLFRILKRRICFLPAAIISSMCIISYSVMCGGTVSSVRACIMMLTAICANGLGRKYDMLSSMSLACILLLIDNPFYLTNQGFILSFSACFSICVLAGPACDHICNGKGYKKPFNRMAGYTRTVIKALVSSMSISAFTLPFIISSYYEYPLYGPVLNIIVLFLVPYIMGGALLGGMAGMVFPGLGRFIIGAPVLLTKAVCFICRCFEKLPFSNILTGHRPGWNMILYYSGIALIIMIMKHGNDKTLDIKDIMKRFILFSIQIAVLMISISIRSVPDSLYIHFLDVDQGECILIRSDTGRNYMIDCGSASVEDIYRNRVGTALKYYGINKIDIVIVTHPDTDHVSGILEMLEENNIRIKMIMAGDFPDNENYLRLISYSDSRDIPVTGVRKGTAVNEGRFSLRCIHPGSEDVYSDINDLSAVTELQYGDFTALFTGDISSEAERDIVSELTSVQKISVLDVSHHGSKYSSCMEFIESFSPDISIISAGVNNSYGHPHREVVRRLEGSGSVVLCTKDCGEIIIKADRDGTAVIRSVLDKQ